MPPPHKVEGSDLTYDVLYVDRDAEFRRSFAQRLSRRDDRLSVTTSGHLEEVWASIDGAADCVVLGSALEGMSLLSVLTELRERAPEFPIVLYPADGCESLASRAMAADVTDYVARESGPALAERLLDVMADHRVQNSTRGQSGESERALRQIIDLLPQLVFAKDASGQYLFANEALAGAYGTAVDSIEGQSDASLANVDAEAEQFQADDRAVIESGESKRIPEEELTFPDGETHVFETRKIPFDPVGSDEPAILGVSTDVTRLKETERNLRRFENAVESAGHAIYITDTEGTIEYVNPAFEEITGYEAAEAIGKTPAILHSGDLSEAYYEEMWETILAGETWHEEIADRRKSGETYYADQTITPITDEAGEIEAFVAIQRDVTERKRLEKRLRRLHEADQELTVAETVAEIGDRAIAAASEILDLPIAGIWWHEDGALVPVAQSDRADEVVGSQPTFERDESLVWRAFEQSEIRIFEDVRKERNAYNRSTSIRTEVIVPLGDQGVMTVSSTTVDAFSDIDVDLIRILAGAVEAAMIRADRERQLREREQELARQNERLDEFSSVVAHDLRNPLSIAIGMLDVARETHDEEHFQAAESALDRMESLIEDLLSLARQGGDVDDRTHVTLAATARECWGYVDTADATLDVVAEEERLLADADRLAQLFENLFQNAIEHGGEDVTVRVGILDSAFYVEDSGAGIAGESDRLFDRGFSTTDNGTGFGLSIVESIATAHGWEANVAEGTDGGARFTFEVPNDQWC